MQLYWIFALIFGIAIALFAVQNSTPVPISFLWVRVEDVAVSVLVLICATLGALVTFLFGLGREIKLRMSRRSSRRAIRSQEQRIADLEAAAQQLEREKIELQARLDALQGTTQPVEQPAPEALPAASEPLSLPSGERPDARRAP
jgi:lipopolysaccharide assembly protein A